MQRGAVSAVALFVGVALLTAASVWLALGTLAAQRGSATGTAGSPPALPHSASKLAAPLGDETAEVDSTAEEIQLQQQLAAYQAPPPAAVPAAQLGGTGEAAGDIKPSQFRGVVWSPPNQKWKAEFVVDHVGPGGSKTVLDLGYFEQEAKAAYAYDEAVRRREHGHAANYLLNFPAQERGFIADEGLLPSRQKCARVPANKPLRRPGKFEQLDAGDCAFMPLRRPEPYLSHQLALLTDVIVTLNKTLQVRTNKDGGSTSRIPVMPWAGSLLGAYRDGDIIPWTSDADILIPLKLLEALQDGEGPEIAALFEVGIITFRSGKTQRFCYHERSPRYNEADGAYCPGRWGLCYGGSYLSHSAAVTYVDGDNGELPLEKMMICIEKWPLISRFEVSVQHHKRLGKCVLADDIRPAYWCINTDECRQPSTVSIRDRTFVAPANAQKIVTALYGWDWQMKDPTERGGGGFAGSNFDVCGWPHRPDGKVAQAVAAGAGGVTASADGGDGGGDDDNGIVGGADEMDLFASTLRGGASSAGGAAKRHGKGRGAGKVRGGGGANEKRAPPTREQMTNILLG